MIPAPISPYGVSKLTCEYYCRVFYLNYGLETFSLRYFNVFGPNQDPAGEYAAVIPQFITCLLQGMSPVVFGDGEQTRDFTYVGDVVEANLRASALKGVQGEIFNIAGGQAISINELARKIAALVGTEISPQHVDPRPGDIRDSLADIALAKERLGFAPWTSLEEGLRLALDWYRTHLA